MRFFIALCPPPDALDVLETVPRPETTGVRWTTRDQWHVTLRFLGEVDVEEGKAALRSLQGFPPRQVTIGPDTRRLGRAILMAPVSGADDLGAALSPDRAFIGHLTLARSRRKHIPDELLGASVSAAWTATSVSLVRSTLRPEGAAYEDVDSVSLEGA